MNGEPDKTSTTLICRREGLLVYYQNSFRTVPYENIRKIRIIPESIEGGNCLRGNLEVTTRNGINFTTPFSTSQVDVNILDELSNSIKIQSFRIALMTNVLIKSIEFD
jgi:hypothetical protein